MTTPSVPAEDPVEAAIRNLIAEAPPITPEQAARLRLLFQPAREHLRRVQPRSATSAA